MRRLIRTAIGAVTAALAVIACTAQAGPGQRRRRRVRRAGLLEDRRLPARRDPGRHPGHPRPGRGQQLHRHRHRGRQRVHRRRAWRQYEAVVFLSTTGDVLNATQQTAFENYIRSGARLRRRARGRRHRVRLALVRQPRRRVVRLAPGDPAGQRQGGEPGAPRRPHTCRRPGPAPTSGTTTAPTPGRPRGCWPRSTSRRTPAAAWAPTTRIIWCKAYDGGRSFYTGVGHTQASYADAAFRADAARRHPLRGGADQGRLPAGDRLHGHLQRIDDRLVAGRAGFVHQHRRHAQVDRRHGAATGTAASSTPRTR